jgi:preprotein translocase subunit SecD
MALSGATLTMPGIAGLVLTIGTAIDGTVVIYERIREELRLGKLPRGAIRTGFDKAFWTILDANTTNLITALVLYQYGTGPIKGFAVTLSIGLVTSVFTALIVPRILFDVYPGNRPVQSLSI